MRVSNNKKKKPKKDVDHVGFRNDVLFCFHCGGSQSLPIEVGAFAAMLEDFTKNHKKCLKTWKQPEHDMSLSWRARRLIRWPMEWYEPLKINCLVLPLDPDEFRWWLC